MKGTPEGEGWAIHHQPESHHSMNQTTESTEATERKPARFDASRRPAVAELEQIVTTATAAADATAQADAADLRRRTGKVTRGARGAADRAKKADADAVLFANAVHAEATGRPGFTVSRSDRARRKSRYRSQSRALVERLDLHVRNGYLEEDRAPRCQFGGHLTVVRPSPMLREQIAGMSWLATLADHRHDEIVMLKGTKKADGHAELQEYEDTPETHAHRADMKFINRYLARADLDYVADLSTDGYGVDTRERFLRRYFTRGSFLSGGRLFGGWWQPLSKEDRLANVLIGGEAVASLDFHAMGPMLAYASLGVMPPSSDLYDIIPASYTFGPPGESQTVTLKRSTVKKLFNACLFAEAPLQQWPRGLQPAGRGVNVAEVITAIKRAHPALTPALFTGGGHTLQLIESSILVDILKRLIVQGITPLPVHDCVVVPESAVDSAHAIMAQAFEQATGLPARISVERAG